jgi:alkylated DNA repair protein (DNA oxidative demethylase)
MTRRAATADLFASDAEPVAAIGPGAVLLHGFAATEQQALVEGIARVAAQAPFRHMLTPGGHAMSVATTSCGSLGWVTDRRGYRYVPADPETGTAWAPMPPGFALLATRAAVAAGYDGFAPDSCLVNCYQPGARMGLHQDRDEQDMGQPIVSVSLGLPATFLWGGPKRAGSPARWRLQSGDVVVWGGPSRLFFHGVDALDAGEHPLTGAFRYNLTFRKAR